MSLPEPKACTACASHVRRGKLHLCTLPIEVFGGLLDSEPSHDDFHADEAEHIGMFCDLVRCQGEICGPAGMRWEPVSE
jgi:hypothetical protein